MKRAICLSGGGAKGAYEIGVWKALKKLNISYDIVTGTSVGALNGALMTQKAFLKAYLLWQKMDFSVVFKEEDLKEFEKEKNAKALLKMYAKNVISGGMDVKELEDLVKSMLDIKKIKKSPIDFGIITVNADTLKPKIIKKNEVEDDKLCDYLIASASCYPVFQKKVIDDTEYIDGGFYDNLPINLAIELGATEVIAVDLKAVGINQPVKNKNIPITYISPRNKIGNFLVFDKEQAEKAIIYGYNDTMKTMNKLDGNIYTFKKDELKKNYKKYGESWKQSMRRFFHYASSSSLGKKILKIASFERIIKAEMEEGPSQMNETIEYILESFDFDDTKVYTINSIRKELRKKWKEVLPASLDEIKDIKIPTPKEIIKFFAIKIPIARTNDKVKEELCALTILFPKEFISAMYLASLGDYYG